MRLDNLNDDEFLKLRRRVEKLEQTGGLNSASISYGRLRIIGGRLLGEAGAALEWIGSIVTRGPFTNEGKFTNTGELEQNGSTRLNGPVAIAGRTEVSNDLIVQGSGSVAVGSAMALDPNVSSGAIVFSNGAQVFTDGSTIQVYLGNGVVQISNSEARLQLGGNAVRVTGDGVSVFGGLQVAALPAASGTTFAVRVDAAGNLYRA